MCWQRIDAGTGVDGSCEKETGGGSARKEGQSIARERRRRGSSCLEGDHDSRKSSTARPGRE